MLKRSGAVRDGRVTSLGDGAVANNEWHRVSDMEGSPPDTSRGAATDLYKKRKISRRAS